MKHVHSADAKKIFYLLTGDQNLSQMHRVPLILWQTAMLIYTSYKLLFSSLLVLNDVFVRKKARLEDIYNC